MLICQAKENAAEPYASFGDKVEGLPVAAWGLALLAATDDGSGLREVIFGSTNGIPAAPVDIDHRD